MPGLAAGLVERKVDVIAASGRRPCGAGGEGRNLDNSDRF